MVAGRAVMCDLCRGMGRIDIAGCPRRAVTDDVRECLEAYVMLSEHKTWPVAGGTQDQASGFLAAVAAIDGEVAVYRNRAARTAGAR